MLHVAVRDAQKRQFPPYNPVFFSESVPYPDRLLRLWLDFECKLKRGRRWLNIKSPSWLPVVPIFFLKNFHFKDIVGLNGLFHRWPGSPIDLSPCDANACHDHVNDPTTAKFGHTVMSGLLIVRLKLSTFTCIAHAKVISKSLEAVHRNLSQSLTGRWVLA